MFLYQHTLAKSVLNLKNGCNQGDHVFHLGLLKYPFTLLGHKSSQYHLDLLKLSMVGMINQHGHHKCNLQTLISHSKKHNKKVICTLLEKKKKTNHIFNHWQTGSSTDLPYRQDDYLLRDIMLATLLICRLVPSAESLKGNCLSHIEAGKRLQKWTLL